MELSWPQRLTRLCKILGTNIVTDDEERQGQALDVYLTSRTKEDQEAEALRFTNSDLGVIGKLAVGQFGTVEVVRCRLDSRVYARKTIEKRVALRARGQCSPQYERDILVKALKTNSIWAPHLLCAFQTETALQLVMQYADGGNLWDLIESSSEGKIYERDLQWWMPQMISAIEWCHSQGFSHRDVKPQNFVLTPTSHLLLIDFGSAAPLLPPSPSGVQLISKEHCLVPCGTIDYISPEILQCYEEALVALELTDDDTSGKPGVATAEGYGRETDWWSFGAMVYEMAYGVAPFFANDIGLTYVKIVDHRTSLKFDHSAGLSHAAISLLQGMLCNKESRFGRHSVTEIKGHAFFRNVDWTNLHTQKAPANLQLPQFTYSGVASDLLGTRITPLHETLHEDQDAEHSQAFAFSALFQSSASISSVRGTPVNLRLSLGANRALDSFVGFSWGPRLSAFNRPSAIDTSLPLHREPIDSTPRPSMPARTSDPLPLPNLDHHAFRTPIRPASVSLAPGHTVSIPKTGTARRMQGRRPVSDREAMQQLVDCVGMSARKKVLESGKKPRHIPAITGSGRLSFKKDSSHSVSFAKPPIIGEREDVSATTSETASEPPSPTPRPGSSLSRRSGWGGRSTPSLMAGRSTPTMNFSVTASGGGAPRYTGSGIDQIISSEGSRYTGLFERKLREAEDSHNKLLDELSVLEDNVNMISLRLKRT